MKWLTVILPFALLLASCSDEDSAELIAPSEPVELLDNFDVHIMDMRADLSVLKDVKFEELASEFQHYPGLPENVLIGTVYLEVNPTRMETLVELAVGTKVDFPVDNCRVKVFMRHHVLDLGALIDTISNEQEDIFVKGRDIIAFRRFGQIDAVMSEITWRVVILRPRENTEVTPF